MTNQSATGSQDFASVVSPRTAPFTQTAPTVIHAHLVSLAGVVERTSFSTTPNKLNTLISLYSWSYTCLPTGSVSLNGLLTNLGRAIQPFRPPDNLLNRASSDVQTADDLVKDRILAGYNLIRYRAESGATSLAFHRGVLSPVKPNPIDFPPSDFGTDLAVMDNETGFMDLSYQLAWELGKILMMSDKTTAAALMRLRRDCHCQGAASAKTKAIETAQSHATPAQITYVSKDSAVSAVAKALSTLAVFKPGNTTFASARWQKASVSESSRSTFSIKTPAVKEQYKFIMDNPRAHYSRGQPSISLGTSAPMECYNEINDPMSTDYAILLAWLMDQWYLQKLPPYYLIPDTTSVPTESIRTFYVDSSWFKAFMDGALSVAEHFTETDEVRESIKANIDDYLKTPLGDGLPPPPVPKWGFFIRSELVAKFPDFRISAPRTVEINEDTEHDGRPEVLRMETIDQDLILALFDREPTLDQFPAGITIHGPEHQLTNALGEAGDLTSTGLTFRYKSTTRIGTDNVRTKVKNAEAKRTFSASDPEVDEFDFKNRLLNPSALTDTVNSVLRIGLDRTNWTATADSEQAGSPASKVLDNSKSSYWHSKFNPTLDPLPHWIKLDMKVSQYITGLAYHPRYDKSFNGSVGTYKIEVSQDDVNWGSSPVATGTFPCTHRIKRVFFQRSLCRYVRLTSTVEAQGTGQQYMSCSELYLIGDPPPSMLASQLIAVVPKLTMACPSSIAIPATAARITSSKKRPGAGLVAAKTSLKNTAPVVTGLAKLGSPPAQNFPKLLAFARTDLYIDDSNSADAKLWNDELRTYRDSGSLALNYWNIKPGSNAKPGPGIPNPQLAINVYNICARSKSSVLNQRSLCALLPYSLGFRSDVQIAIESKAAAAGYKLSKVELVLLHGDDLRSLLRPLNAQSLPTVRCVAPGRRWKTSVALSRDGNLNFFTITITPNKGTAASPGSWDISQIKDLSIVMEDVQLNCWSAAPKTSSTAQVQVVEYYAQTPSGSTNQAVSAFTSVQVVYVDVSSG